MLPQVSDLLFLSAHKCHTHNVMGVGHPAPWFPATGKLGAATDEGTPVRITTSLKYGLFRLMGVVSPTGRYPLPPRWAMSKVGRHRFYDARDCTEACCPWNRQPTPCLLACCGTGDSSC
mgnify:FL=1